MLKNIYISIINWRDRDNTLECLEHLNASLGKSNRLVIFLINHERDKRVTKKDCKRYSQLDISISNFDENRGFVSHNIILERAIKDSVPYVLILNNDTIMSADEIIRLLKYMEHNPHAALVNPAIVYYKQDKVWFGGSYLILPLGLTTHKFKGSLFSEYKKIKTSPYHTDIVTGACLLCRTESLKEIGVFDDDYFAYYEDADLSFRCHEKGYETIVEPNIVIEHKVSASANRGKKKITSFQAHLWGRNAVLFARKRLNFPKRLLYLFGQIPRFLIYLLRFENIRSMFHYWRGVFDGLMGRRGTQGIVH